MIMKLVTNVAVSVALVCVWLAVCGLFDLGPYSIRTGMQVIMFGGYGWPSALSCFRSSTGKLRKFSSCK